MKASDFAEMTVRRKRVLLVPEHLTANSKVLPTTRGFGGCCGCLFDKDRYFDSDGACQVQEEVEEKFGVSCWGSDRILILKRELPSYVADHLAARMSQSEEDFKPTTS